MKKATDQIARILGEAEESLRKVIGQAAQAADYEAVDAARVAALEVHDLKVRTSAGSDTASAESAPTSPRSVSRKPTRRSTRKRTKRDYPKFRVTSNRLVRVGWSKKQGREYTHKAPKAVFDKAIALMAALGRPGDGPVTAEQVIEDLNRDASQPTPGYQIYVVIGLLRRSGCIEQMGREGYRIRPDLVPKANAEWQRLSSEKC